MWGGTTFTDGKARGYVGGVVLQSERTIRTTMRTKAKESRGPKNITTQQHGVAHTVHATHNSINSVRIGAPLRPVINIHHYTPISNMYPGPYGLCIHFCDRLGNAELTGCCCCGGGGGGGVGASTCGSC